MQPEKVACKEDLPVTRRHGPREDLAWQRPRRVLRESRTPGPRPLRQLQPRYVRPLPVRVCMCVQGGGGAARGEGVGSRKRRGGNTNSNSPPSIARPEVARSILGIVVPGATLRLSRGLSWGANAASGPSLERGREWTPKTPDLARASIRFAFVWRHDGVNVGAVGD